MRALWFLWAVQGFAAFNLTWGIPASNLDSNPPLGDTDSNSAIAIAPSGNAVATWSRTVGRMASEEIWVATYNHLSRAWTCPVKTSGGGTASNSQVAVDPEGNAVLVWEEGFPSQIMTRTLSAEGVWTPPLASPPDAVLVSPNAQTSPQLSIDAAGNAVAIWMELQKGIYHIQSAKKTFGFRWKDLGLISSNLYTSMLIPIKAIAMNRAGEAVAVWQEKRGGFHEVHGARYLNGAWTPAIAIAATEEQNAQYPSVGIDEAGNSFIVWNQSNTILSKRIVNGKLSEVFPVSNPAYTCQRPNIAVDAEGNAVVVFERHNEEHKLIAGATFLVKNGEWSPQVDISGPCAKAAGAGHPILSLNTIGDGVVIWKEFNGKNMIIQGAGYSLGTWSFVKTLSSMKNNSGAPYPAYDFAVSVNSSGDIAAVWPEDPSGKGTHQIKAAIGASENSPDPAASIGVSVNSAGNVVAIWPQTPVEDAPPQITVATGVGIAIDAPLPPVVEPTTVQNGVAYGVQVLHRFPAHGDLVNMLSWSGRSGVAYYNIYRGNYSSLIGTTDKLQFEDHQRIPKKKEVYLITSVDKNGQESGPMTLIVQPR